VVPVLHPAGVHLHTAVLLPEVQARAIVLLQEVTALLLPAEVLQVEVLQEVALVAAQAVVAEAAAEAEDSCSFV